MSSGTSITTSEVRPSVEGSDTKSPDTVAYETPEEHYRRRTDLSREVMHVRADVKCMIAALMRSPGDPEVYQPNRPV